MDERAIDTLRQDHRIIEKVLRALQIVVERLESGRDVSPQVLEDALDFVRGFADACHHSKEEEILFPALEQHGLPRQGGPIGVMLIEHEEGRKLIRAMAEAVSRHKSGDGGARDAIIQNARGYVNLLTQHIWKEENILFRMAEQTLTDEEQTELLQGFEKVERDKIGLEKHRGYLQLAERLEERLRSQG